MPLGTDIQFTQVWRDMHHAHRGRIRRARAQVDSSSPQLNVQGLFRASELRTDTENYKRINRMNMDLLLNINGFLRTEGIVRPWRDKPKTTSDFSKIYEKTQWVEKVEKENRELGMRIKAAKPNLTTRRPEDILKHRQKCEAINFEAVMKIMKKYENCKITLPTEPTLLRHALRPIVFMDIGMPGVCAMNRIYIKLYTEACPEAVLEFMRVFKNEQAHKIFFNRIYPGVFMEGHIVLSENVLRVGKTEYDKRVINHGSSSGILSIPKFLVHGCGKRELVFFISFKKLPALNKKSLGFGRICRGLRNFIHMKGNGLQNGSPIKPITISKLGIIR